MNSRWRAAGIVVLTTTALGAAAIWQARAQIVPPPTTTAPPQTSPTTTATTPSTFPRPTTVPKPPPTQPKAPPPTQPPPPATVPPAPTTSTTVKPGPQIVPPDAQAQINAVKRTPPNSTAALIQALGALEEFGLTPQEAINVGFGHFPVAGMANWSDDWLMPRFTPSFHLHQGNDIFAAGGTPIRAVYDGTVSFSEEPVGGKDVYLRMANAYFFCAHASDFAPGITSGQSVKQGTIIGFVGDTGDAQGGATHCHFEMHPNGGTAIDPKSTLDGWVNEALANVPKLIASYQANAPKAVAAAGFIRRFDVGDQGMFSAPGRPPAGPLLWASSVNPAGGTLRLAQAEVVQAAGEMDWDQLLADEEAKTQEWQQARTSVLSIMSPLMPQPLATLYPAPSPGF